MLVGGKIMRVGSEFMLYADLINPQNAQVIYSTRKSIKVEDELPQTADNITREILDYLNIQSNSSIASDLEPWRQGTGNIEAVKAFEMASRYTYRVERGGEEYLRQAIGFDSSFISPRIWLIATLAQTGRYDEARQHYEVLLRLKARANSFDKAMIEWCDGYLGKDKIHQAQALERALEYSRSNNILLANLADIRYGLGDYQSALDALLPIVKMRWNYGPVYSLAGKCYLKLGKYKEARQLLEGSLGIPKPAGDTYALLAALYLRNGDTSKADEYTSKALRIYNESSYAWEEVNEYIGIDFLAVKCWNEAIEYFRKVLHRNPRSASAHQNLANALYGRGNRETALAEYQQALQLDSTLGDVHYSIGKICDEQGKIQAAINHYRLFLKYDSISINALNAKKREQGLTSIQISNKQQH
jgi:tetratricopeptide (TPR) repeat protein